MTAKRSTQALIRACRFGITAAIAGALVGLGAALVAPSTYTSTSHVLLTPAAGVRASDAVDDRLLESYAALLGGPSIAAAVRDDTTSTQTIGSIEDSLTGEVVKGSSMLRVTAHHGNARTAAALSGSAAQSLVTLLVDRGIARVAPATSPTEEGKAASATVVASVVDESGTASRPSSPSVSWWLAIGALIGLLLGLAVSAARQLTHQPIRTPDDLTEATGAPMLAAIGYDRTANRNPLVTDLDPGDPRFEASRLLRTNLQFVDVDSTETVLTVTSSMPGEGKSTTVANLAIALAHGGASVVLVDADLRRPQLDELFGLDSVPGLTTALVGTVDLADAVQETSVHGLDVLTTGALPPNPSELLQTNAMADLVLTLRRRYDIVLFDAPPLLPVTDAALLATLSDGAVLLVRHGRTTAEQVRAAAGRLESVGADLLGTVLTMVPARGIARYGYGYEYQDAPKRTAGSGEGRRARR